MDFAFVSLRAQDDQIYLATPIRQRISQKADDIRRLIEDDKVSLRALWKPVLEIAQDSLFAAASEGKAIEDSPVWQVGAMALTEPARLGKVLGSEEADPEATKVVLNYWRELGERVADRQDRWIGKEPSERQLIYLIFKIVEQAEGASWGLPPAELARIGGMGLFVAGYLGLKIGRLEAGIAFAALAAMDELELLNQTAGQAAVKEARQRGLDIDLGAAMPFLIDDGPEA